MMKKKLLLLLSMLSYVLGFSQYMNRVGINTDKPEAELHVKGSFKAQDLLLDQSPYTGDPDPIPKLTPSESYSFLLKSEAAKRITTYNVQSAQSNNFPAPFGVINFIINVTVAEDWVNGYDTKINATKYLAIINSFNYNNPVVYSAGNSTARRVAPVAQVYTYIQNGTWWIKADYHSFAHTSANTNPGQWEIALMVFDKEFAKVFPVTVDMNGSTTAAAAAPIIPIQ